MATSWACSPSPPVARFTSSRQLKCVGRDIRCIRKPFNIRISASLSSTLSSQKSDELVASLLSKVMQTDRGVLLTRDEHKKVAELTEELNKFCVDEPVKCPLIFGAFPYSKNHKKTASTTESPCIETWRRP